jgi:hypothetical protein
VITGIVLTMLLIATGLSLWLLLITRQQQRRPAERTSTPRVSVPLVGRPPLADRPVSDWPARVAPSPEAASPVAASPVAASPAEAEAEGDVIDEVGPVDEFDEIDGQFEETRPYRPAWVQGGPGSVNAEACWWLLLSRVERQWAEAVGARPEERGVARASRGDQLAEAVRRELERLREEVGISADVVVTTSGDVGEIDTVAGLLAVGEALIAVAPVSERVQVDVGPQLVVIAEECLADAMQLEQLVAMVGEAGMASTLEMGEGRVRIVFGAGVAGRV